jgi:hypothetical protein
MTDSDLAPSAKLERGRHVRLAWYVLVCCALSLIGYYCLGLDRPHAMAYAVAAYAILVMLNCRTLLSRIERVEPLAVTE